VVEHEAADLAAQPRPNLIRVAEVDSRIDSRVDYFLDSLAKAGALGFGAHLRGQWETGGSDSDIRKGGCNIEDAGSPRISWDELWSRRTHG